MLKVSGVFRIEVMDPFPKLPKGDRVIILCNHHSLFDPPLWALVSPFRRPYTPVRFIAKEAFFKNPFANFALRYIGGSLPAFRLGNRPISILTEKWVAAMEKGHALVVFPEGEITTSASIKEFKPGAPYVAMRMGAWVVPIALAGNLGTKRLRGRTYTYAIGEPIWVSKSEDCKNPDKVRSLGRVLRAAMAQQQERLCDAGKGNA